MHTERPTRLKEPRPRASVMQPSSAVWTLIEEERETERECVCV